MAHNETIQQQFLGQMQQQNLVAKPMGAA